MTPCGPWALGAGSPGARCCRLLEPENPPSLGSRPRHSGLCPSVTRPLVCVPPGTSVTGLGANTNPGYPHPDTVNQLHHSLRTWRTFLFWRSEGPHSGAPQRSIVGEQISKCGRSHGAMCFSREEAVLIHMTSRMGVTGGQDTFWLTWLPVRVAENTRSCHHAQGRLTVYFTEGRTAGWAVPSGTRGQPMAGRLALNQPLGEVSPTCSRGPWPPPAASGPSGGNSAAGPCRLRCAESWGQEWGRIPEN